MTQMGEGSASAAIELEENGLYFLYYQLVDENGRPLKNIPYKTVQVGASAEPAHIADGETNTQGKTFVVSTEKDEEIDCYLVWAKLTINKGFFKG
jgi:hypothetical protein